MIINKNATECCFPNLSYLIPQTAIKCSSEIQTPSWLKGTMLDNIRNLNLQSLFKWIKQALSGLPISRMNNEDLSNTAYQKTMIGILAASLKEVKILINTIIQHAVEYSTTVTLAKIKGPTKRRYICNVFCHWLRPKLSHRKKTGLQMTDTPSSTEALEYHGISFLFLATYFSFPRVSFISATYWRAMGVYCRYSGENWPCYNGT